MSTFIQNVYSEDRSSDSVSYKVPDYHDSMVFFTASITDSRGVIEDWAKKTINKTGNEDLIVSTEGETDRIRVRRPLKIFGKHGFNAFGYNKYFEIPASRIRKLVMSSDLQFSKCGINQKYAESAEKFHNNLKIIYDKMNAQPKKPESLPIVLSILNQSKELGATAENMSTNEKAKFELVLSEMEKLKKKITDPDQPIPADNIFYNQISQAIAEFQSEGAPCLNESRKNRLIIPKNEQVFQGDPLSLIVNKIRLPVMCDLCLMKDDVAAVVDIDTGKSTGKDPVIVKYVRNAPNNGTMDFRDLTVYTNENWSGQMMPYLRFRLIDVEADDNKDMEAFLSGTSQMVGQMSQLSMNPAINASVQVGIAAANILLTNADNEPIMDFEFQMYSNDATSHAGDSELMKLKTGLFVITSLPEANDYTPEEIHEYWNQDLFIDTKTGFIFTFGEEGNECYIKDDNNSECLEHLTINIVDTPVLLGTLMTHSTKVPAIIETRTAELREKLMSQSQTSTEDFKKLGESLNGALKVYATQQEIRKARKEEAKSRLCDYFDNQKVGESLDFDMAKVLQNEFKAKTEMSIPVDELMVKPGICN